MEVEALAPVARRLRKPMPSRVREAFDREVQRLRTEGPHGPPDRSGGWKRAWGRSITNHRHVDLPDGWRLCYTVEAIPAAAPTIVLLFLGTHREYDHKYGFRPSG